MNVNEIYLFTIMIPKFYNHKVLLEVDYQVSVKFIDWSNVLVKANSIILSRIKALTNQQWMVDIQYEYREVNTCTDWIAWHAFSRAQGVLFYNDLLRVVLVCS